MTINHVVDVDAFDEKNLWANIKDGAIEISGENLSVLKLDLEEGILVITGTICTFSYSDKKNKEKGRIMKVLRKNYD